MAPRVPSPRGPWLVTSPSDRPEPLRAPSRPTGVARVPGRSGNRRNRGGNSPQDASCGRAQVPVLRLVVAKATGPLQAGERLFQVRHGGPRRWFQRGRRGSQWARRLASPAAPSWGWGFLRVSVPSDRRAHCQHRRGLPGWPGSHAILAWHSILWRTTHVRQDVRARAQPLQPPVRADLSRPSRSLVYSGLPAGAAAEGVAHKYRAGDAVVPLPDHRRDLVKAARALRPAQVEAVVALLAAVFWARPTRGGREERRRRPSMQAE